MLALDLAESYFDYSNQSSMDKIEKLFSDNATYYSANFGFFIGKSDIMTMQAAFHRQYRSLQWTIESIDEVKTGVVKIAFGFIGVLNNGMQQNRQGSEYIVICDGLIQHIAVGL
jgi:hypothetical protein